MTIFLIGFMGSGKSTIGKKLANKLGYTFLDMDREIEAAEKKSIAHLFKENGEAYFRLLESDWLKNYSGQNAVVSTGGGTPCFNGNLELMKHKGKTVFLRVNAGILAQRLFHANHARPLLENYTQSQEQLEKYIQQKLDERLPVYEKSDITIDCSDFDRHKLENLVNLIRTSL
ncbi:MAG: shikimate kinase [Bacteroidetes bacterium]|nr:shikimate kinase [Bacteroidota bacterium]